jgi:hypothetical protein
VEPRAFGDDEIIRVVLPYLQQEWEYWRPWHDFRFAVASGIDTSLFKKFVRSAVLHGNWGRPSPELDSGLEERAIELLRGRAEKALRPLNPIRHAWPALYPDSDYRKNVVSVSKRAGDIRKFSNEEIAEALDLVQGRYPQISDAIEKAVAYNSDLSPDDVDYVNVYHWVFDPLKHALFGFYPEFDSIDNSALARGIYDAIRDRALEAYPPTYQPPPPKKVGKPPRRPTVVQRLREQAHFRAILAELPGMAAKYEYVPEDRKLTTAAEMKLEALFVEETFLSMGRLAFDVYRTLEDVLASERNHSDEYVAREFAKLYHRIYHPTYRKWPMPPTREFVARLGIGLDSELDWLKGPTNDAKRAEAVRWFYDFGPAVKRFTDFVERNIPGRMRKLDKAVPR